MKQWLQGQQVRLLGESNGIRKALEARGATISDEGGADILIHIASPPEVRPLHEMTHAQWRETLEAGLDQRFRAAQDFAKERRVAAKGGAILFVGAPEQALGSDQAAASGALGNLTKTLGVEWARDGIRVNAVQTSDTGEALGNLAAYLVSDYAAYITGTVTGIAGSDV